MRRSAVTPRRRYRMTARAKTSRRTADKIVQAAVKLHARQGVRATSWDDLAAVGGVSRATVYRHFPDLAALVPSCARAAFAAIDLPAPDVIEREFSGLATAEERLERLVRETCACYERGAEWLHAAEREGDVVPELGAALRRIRKGVAVLVEVALRPASPTEERRRVVGTLLDFTFWRRLRDNGIAARAVPGVIFALARSQFRR